MLRCSFSNKLMDEDDAPCCLPNGAAVCKSLITRLAHDLYGHNLPLSAWLDLGSLPCLPQLPLLPPLLICSSAKPLLFSFHFSSLPCLLPPELPGLFFAGVCLELLERLTGGARGVGTDSAIGAYDVADAVHTNFRICQLIVS